jgi:two-component system invasion response regulator UvrY
MHEESAFAVQALRAGAAGYVTKSSPPALLLEALRDVHRGARPLSPDVAHAMALQSFERDSLADLTPREFSILQALVDGNSTSAIAEQLHLSPKTVANIHYGIKRKLGVTSDIELVRLVLRLGAAGEEA